MIENGCCKISYPHGTMVLRMETYFPATQADIRTLFKKTIARCENRYQIARDIQQWLIDTLNDMDADNAMHDYANRYQEAKTKAKEMQPDIDRQASMVEILEKYCRNFVPKKQVKQYQEQTIKPEKEKLKELKEKQKNLLSDARYNNGQFIRIQSQSKKFKNNICLIAELTEGWY